MNATYAPSPPRILLSGARAAYVGPGLQLAPHRNAAATVAIALDAPFRLAMPATEPRSEVRWATVIPPNTRHHLVADGAMAFVYLDAVSDDFRKLRERDLTAASERLRGAAPDARARWDLTTLCDAMGLPARSGTDPRVVAAIRCLDARPQDFPHVADLAAIARLSPSRFQARFSQATGLPFRRYRLWRRMAVVMQAVAGGASLTDAALGAGFSSSAHLSATFRDMFGLSPSALNAAGARTIASGYFGAASPTPSTTNQAPDPTDSLPRTTGEAPLAARISVGRSIARSGEGTPPPPESLRGAAPGRPDP